MKYLRGLLTFIWEFVVGDDWVIAVGVVMALGLTALIADSRTAWWVMPVAVALLLTVSVWRAARPTEEATSEDG
jgi:hypothetical protein